MPSNTRAGTAARWYAGPSRDRANHGWPDSRHVSILARSGAPRHVTTFLESGGGIVTILAFDQPLEEPPAGQGQWLGRYWRFAEVAPGKTILLLADNVKVLAETERLLGAG